ncbi:unnamed protein product [Caenorhabditis bovis]|uniref:Uncharacterized protein n=1 Tax=Caenorhabditis bovis TaxID=2654633 RepID=A0A8S1ERS7_9PELO|nr:unnamed protein product [Caenorhabditis bovis]
MQHNLIYDVEPSTSNSKMPSPQMRQVLAQAVIEKLQHWCMQLFWMTILCVINCCGDEKKSPQNPSITPSLPEKKKRQSLSDIEQKMLRHLTSPYLASPLRPVIRPTKKRILSRPPSPQLFDIAEEEY